MDLKNKVALLTGGARMGETVAGALAQRGCDVILTYRNSRESAERTARKVRSYHRNVLLINADLTREEDIAQVFYDIERKFKRLDILINMASIYQRKALKDLEGHDWDQNIEANLKSAYLLSLKASALMKKGKWGRIINFSDWTSRSGRPRYYQYVPYYISKTGILGLTEVFALELAPKILVNAIAPGPILPPVGLNRRESKRVIASTPLRKWGGAAEIAKTVLFLVETEFITGECIRVDGGRHLY